MVRVLVVSDQPLERLRATTAMHGEDDLQVSEATGPREARDAVVAGEVDVLVVDGDLAPKGGFSMLYEIRNMGELDGRPSPPALMLVAREQDRWLARWSGANEVLRKPVDPFVVARTVRALHGVAPAPADPAFDAPRAVRERMGMD